MPSQTGTYDISSLISVRKATVKEFGLDTIVAILQSDLAAHNAIVEDLVGSLCDVATDAQRIYGASAFGEMTEVDEFGRAATQRASGGTTVGFPLRGFQYAIGWNAKWMDLKTPADMAQAQLAAQAAHKRALVLAIRRSIFGSVNYTARDYLVDNVDVPVKRFLNADGSSIPNGPNAETFNAGTHTHYDATAALTAANLTASIEDVIEHGHGNSVKVAIARADEAAVRALTGFVAYLDPRLIAGANANVPENRLDISRLDNRAIGLFGAAEVWVKPWALASYPFVWDAGTPNKPLCFRQRSQESLQGLRIAAQLDTFPLYAEYMEAEFGVGVWTRTNGAILYTGGGAYVNPVIP